MNPHRPAAFLAARNESEPAALRGAVCRLLSAISKDPPPLLVLGRWPRHHTCARVNKDQFGCASALAVRLSLLSLLPSAGAGARGIVPEAEWVQWARLSLEHSRKALHPQCLANPLCGTSPGAQLSLWPVNPSINQTRPQIFTGSLLKTSRWHGQGSHWVWNNNNHSSAFDYGYFNWMSWDKLLNSGGYCVLSNKLETKIPPCLPHGSWRNWTSFKTAHIIICPKRNYWGLLKSQALPASA